MKRSLVLIGVPLVVTAATLAVGFPAGEAQIAAAPGREPVRVVLKASPNPFLVGLDRQVDLTALYPMDPPTECSWQQVSGPAVPLIPWSTTSATLDVSGLPAGVPVTIEVLLTAVERGRLFFGRVEVKGEPARMTGAVTVSTAAAAPVSSVARSAADTVPVEVRAMPNPFLVGSDGVVTLAAIYPGDPPREYLWQQVSGPKVPLGSWDACSASLDVSELPAGTPVTIDVIITGAEGERLYLGTIRVRGETTPPPPSPPASTAPIRSAQ